MTPEQLAAQLGRDATIVGRTIPTEVAGIVVDVAEQLADVTPILTGRARSGWVAAKGSPSLGEQGRLRRAKNSGDVTINYREGGSLLGRHVSTS